MRSGGAHGRYGVGDWGFLKCRQHMATASAIFISPPKIDYYWCAELAYVKLLWIKHSAVCFEEHNVRPYLT